MSSPRPLPPTPSTTMLLMPHPISSRGTDAAGVTSAYIADSDEEYRRSPPPPYELVLMEEGAAGGAVVTERVRDLEAPQVSTPPVTARPLDEHGRDSPVAVTSPLVYPPPPAPAVPAPALALPAPAPQPSPSGTATGLGRAGDALLCRAVLYFVAVLLVVLFVVLIVYALSHAAAAAPPAATQRFHLA